MSETTTDERDPRREAQGEALNPPKGPPANDPNRMEGRRDRQRVGLGGIVYANLLSRLPVVSQDLVEAALDYAADFLQRMNPASPEEEMAAFQLLWTHTQVAWLAVLVSRQTTLQNQGPLMDLYNRTTASFQKQLSAWSDRRRSAHRSQSLVAILQTNLAQQQVIQQLHVPVQGDRKLPNNESLLEAVTATTTPPHPSPPTANRPRDQQSPAMES